MTDPSRGVLDTSVLIDHDIIAAEQLPDESAITAVTLDELAAGPHAPKIRTSAPGARIDCSGRPPPGSHYLWMLTRHGCTARYSLPREQPDNPAEPASRTCLSLQRLQPLDCRSHQKSRQLCGPEAHRQSCQGLVRCRWPEMAGIGVGDRNRKYRPGSTNLPKSKRYELARALRAIIV